MPPRRPSIPVCAWMLVFLTAAPLAAAVINGAIKSVDARARRLVVETRSGKTEDLTVSSGTTVTIDDRKKAVSDLKAGMSVTVFTDSNDRVTRIISRSGEPAAKPSTQTSTAPRQQPAVRRPARTPAASRIASGSGAGSTTSPGDWPQFDGPYRDNISRETGLRSRWPADGPPLAWTARGLGRGYASDSVADGVVYTMGNIGSDETVSALNLADGRKLWTTRIGPASQPSAGDGPRATPTVDGDRVYAMGADGLLACLDAKSGDIRWQKNILDEFGGSKLTWGICESVVVDGDQVICTPGGRGATMAALNKMNGNVVWTCLVPGGVGAGYASPVVADVQGVRQYIQFTAKGTIGVRANDGMFLWGNDRSANGTANCSTPLFVDNHVFSASGYNTGGALLRLASRSGRTEATFVYHTRDMKNHHGGMVALDGYIYGSNDPGILTCLEMKSGRVVWQDRSVGKGSLTCADGHLYLRSENGPVALIEATPAGYREKGRFDQPQRSGANSWPHPVVSNGKLFLRDQDILLAYDIKE